MEKQFLVMCLLMIISSCKQKNNQTKAITPIIKLDSITADYEVMAIAQNKGFANGMTASKMNVKQGKALSFIKQVLASQGGEIGKKDVLDIYFDEEDSSYYMVDYYPYSSSDYQRPKTQHLLFFPRTKKIFFFQYSDTLLTDEFAYDTLKFKYKP